MSSLNPDPCARGSHATERVTVRRGDGLGELCAVAEPSEGNNSMYRTVPVLLGFAPLTHHAPLDHRIPQLVLIPSIGWFCNQPRD